MSKTVGLRWQLEGMLVYDSEVSAPPTRFIVSEGFKTGFSSIPRALRWLVLPKDCGPRRATAPAVLYAWLLKQSGETPSAARVVYREALGTARVPFWQRLLLRMMR